jgi:hypothetical protein
MMRIALLAALALLTAPALAAPAEPRVVLESVRAQLLYERSGTLSDDLVTATDFAAWNVMSGGGDAKEPANDVLVGAVLTAPGADEVNVASPLTLTVRAKSRRGEPSRILARRVFSGVFLTHGKAVSSVLLRDATCDGAITIEAVFGRQRKVATIHLECGE